MNFLVINTDQYDKMAQEFREMQLNHYQLREKYDDLVEKMKFFTKVGYIFYSPAIQRMEKGI